MSLKARLHIHGSDHDSLLFVTVSKIVENRDEPWSESSFLRMPTTSVRCFYEFMPDCAGYDHGRSRFITPVLRSVTVLLRFDRVLLRFLTVVLRLITMPLRFDSDGAGTCTVIDGHAMVDYGLLRRDDDHVTV